MKSLADRPVLLAALGSLALLAQPAMAQTGPEGDYPVTVGDPYVIGGVTYSPADTLNYDAVGYAHAGTAGAGISGAHHTLPLPCYVEVTALDTGHTVLVRLDRRGPMDGKQLVELSPDAWKQLGLPAGADAPVRVRRVNPPEQERTQLRQGNRAPERMETPQGLLTALRRKLGIATPTTPDEPPSMTLAGVPAGAKKAPTTPGMATTDPIPAAAPVKLPNPPAAPAKAPPPPPPVMPVAPAVVAKPQPPKPEAAKPAAPKPEAPKPVAPKPVAEHHAPAGHIIVQVAAFSSKERADKAAASVGGTVEPIAKLWRVRIIAKTEEEARAGLAKAKQAGYAGALILHHE